jgi:antitoxin ParD1/3/4
MTKAEKLEVFLSPEIAAAVKDAMAGGEYNSVSDVISDALSEWHISRAGDGLTVEELRQLVQEGIDSGPGRFESIEEIIAEAHRRLDVGKTEQ